MTKEELKTLAKNTIDQEDWKEATRLIDELIKIQNQENESKNLCPYCGKIVSQGTNLVRSELGNYHLECWYAANRE